MMVTVSKKAAAGKVVLWERDSRHPAGEVYLVGGRHSEVEVGDTPAVQRRIKDGLLVEVEESAEPALTDIPGIGKATAKKLAELDITSPADLATADVTDLAEKLDMPADKVLAWQKAAKELAE